MSSSHKAGSESEIDYAVVGIMLLWIAAVIALVILLVVRGHADNRREAVRSGHEFCERADIGQGGNHGRADF